MNISPAGITIIGERTEHHGLCATDGNERSMPWFRDLGSTPHLEEFGFRHLGIVRAVAPYRFERKRIPQPIFLACAGGLGRVKTGGHWMELPPGTATLLPAGKAAAYHAVVGEAPWSLVWLCFGKGSRVPEASRTGRREFEVRPLFHAVECLLAECGGSHDSWLVRQSLGMIERMVGRFISPLPEMARFYSAWELIETELDGHWELSSMSRLAACSSEQFRRLCQREFATSPRRHLTRLRLTRAKRGLLESRRSIEDLAHEAGYSDPWAFTDAFRKHHGVTPRDLRRGDVANALEPEGESPREATS
ncbi:AraC-like DNA-binding protein [Haloferula luteola]|uniref:AraC-like DNA-binding protein n=1 Tax=Haloferula luteola TaxID=595692 RepID=A0A840V6N3_9BACT|nr:AraC family transcriptional regulator [Haloferula luteola]MBB5350428.1 AraC-like DNA-binding protein [Haloferula luteola]